MELLSFKPEEKIIEYMLYDKAGSKFGKYDAE